MFVCAYCICQPCVLYVLFFLNLDLLKFSIVLKCWRDSCGFLLVLIQSICTSQIPRSSLYIYYNNIKLMVECPMLNIYLKPQRFLDIRFLVIWASD